MIQKTKELNQEYPQHPFPDISFHAVDCAQHKDICDAYHVDYYPVVLPIKFDAKQEIGKFIEGIEVDIYKYLSLTIFQVSVN